MSQNKTATLFVLNKIYDEYQAFGKYSNNIITYHCFPPLEGSNQPSTLLQKQILNDFEKLEIINIKHKRKVGLSKKVSLSFDLLVNSETLSIYKSTWSKKLIQKNPNFQFLISKSKKTGFLNINGHNFLTTKDPNGIRWSYLKYLIKYFEQHCTCKQLYEESNAPHTEPYPKKGKTTGTNKNIRRNINHLKKELKLANIPLRIVSSKGFTLIWKNNKN